MMEDKFNNEEGVVQKEEQPVYTDPNADVVPEPDVTSEADVTLESDVTSESEQKKEEDFQYHYADPGQYSTESSQNGQNSEYQYQSQNGQDTQYQYQQSQSKQNTQYQNNYEYNTTADHNYTQNYDQGMDEKPMSMGDWLITLVVSMIPCVGIVFYFVWAFSQTGNVNRRNFCRAQLIIMAASFVISLVFVVIFAIAGVTLAFGM